MQHVKFKILETVVSKNKSFARVDVNFEWKDGRMDGKPDANIAPG